MAFGQPAGPPASARQVERLAELLTKAGFESFREARHPFGLTQRQAAGKFTVAEVDELIERLEAAELVQHSRPEPAAAGSEGASIREPDPPPSVSTERPTSTRPATARPATARPGAKRTTLRSLPDEVLATELERRGWCCIPPPRDEM